MTEPRADLTPEAASGEAIEPARLRHRARGWTQILDELEQRGWKDSAPRTLGNILLVLVAVLGVAAARLGLRSLPTSPGVSLRAGVASPQASPTAAAPFGLEDLPPYSGGALSYDGIPRLLEIHTTVPTRPRLEIVKYVVQSGDTLFGIAENYGLKPESVLWANYDVLLDDPHSLIPGQELNILPVDGVLYVWNEGDGLNGVASFYGVSAQEILDWPGNDIDPGTDPENPDIAPGTALVVPGGHRETVTWASRITRADPARARILGPGACGTVYDGPIGAGSFIWPTPLHYVGGFGYSSIHPAIDIAGDTGHGIFASDSGVVVFAGWNNGGYGNVIVVDHGNGWQTLYAHLSQVNVACGQAVFPGNVIGLMGCTGNCSGDHLHFEMMHDTYGKVNPLNFLP
jgi:murein DD-endopeptidase MepM/ murein hydrolase activator NlpD